MTMAEPFQYLPVLRWKRAEQKALRKLDPTLREHVCPLIEIPPVHFPKDGRCTNLASSLIDKMGKSILSSCCGRSAFLDLIHLDRFRPQLRISR